MVEAPDRVLYPTLQERKLSVCFPNISLFPTPFYSYPSLQHFLRISAVYMWSCIEQLGETDFFRRDKLPDSIRFLLLIPTGKKDLVEEPMFYFKG